ncbi:MAG: 2-oxo acid dehydrogenase subunit E2 [Nannocystaceae bacterium]|nr:2-oxo acid dehydrogenase subunit E2 [Nannocystaceae bacterium]
MDDDGRYTVIDPPPDRRFAMEAFAALPPSHPMVALLELDVTAAEQAITRLREQGTRVSLFALLVRAIAGAIAAHPELNLVQHGRRFVRFEDVDVSVPVEVETPHGRFPREVVLRRAQHKSAVALFAELEQARTQHRRTGDIGAEDGGSRKLFRWLRFVPRFIRIALVRRMMADAFTIKRRAGTTLVTSVGKFAAVPGFGFALMTGPRAATFAIGTVSPRPWLHDGAIAVRSILGFAMIINHDLVDGAPAARFAVTLQQLVEHPDATLLGGGNNEPVADVARPCAVVADDAARARVHADARTG